MQMAETKPTVMVLKPQPPAEPPPSLEKSKSQDENKLWVNDVTTTAFEQLLHETNTKVAKLKGYTYNPHNAGNRDDIDQHVLKSKIKTAYNTSHPQPQYMSIPTPKSTTARLHQYDTSTWKDNETINWELQNKKWKNTTATNNPTPSLETDLIKKWNSMIGKPTRQINTAKKSPILNNQIRICTEKVQSDTGANQAVTNNKDALYAYSDIDPYPIGGVKADEVAIVCTGHGLLPWQSREGNIIMVRTMYCRDVDGTIISPTTVVHQNSDIYQGFTIDSDCDNGVGILKLNSRDNKHHHTFHMTLENGLWYHHYEEMNNFTPSIKRMNAACYSNLWHGRLAHAGQKITAQIHKHVKGIPYPIQHNPLSKCASCVPNKMSKKPHKRTNKHKNRGEKVMESSIDHMRLSQDDPEDISDVIKEGVAGQHFHMDFGFVRGTGYKIKQEHAPTVTSIDGFSSYLIIVDRVTRYLWIFLTKSKTPPITIAQRILNKFKCKNRHRTVRTDQGKELGKSKNFQDMVDKEGFTLELTGSDASAQNAIAESPNKYLGNMMRCMLHAADLGPEYWSFALIHAAYIKNRLPHTAIKQTPYEAITGEQPDLTNLRTFGCRIFAKKPGKRPAKLDHHTSNGIFLGYTATTKNVYFIDDKTRSVKMGVHCIFDEAHFTVQKDKAPIAAQTLQCLGYRKPKDIYSGGKFICDQIIDIQLIHTNAKPPAQQQENSNIFEIYSASPSIIIPPGEQRTVETGITMNPPLNGYLQIKSPPHGFNILDDRIYHNEAKHITVTIDNNSNDIITVNKGSCVGHVFHHKLKDIQLKITKQIQRRASSRQKKQIYQTTPPAPQRNNNPMVIPYSDDEMEEPDSSPTASPKIHNMTTTVEPPYQICLSSDPFDNLISIDMKTNGQHPTLGLDLKIHQEFGNRVQLKQCLHSTPAAKIPKWRSHLRNSFLHSIEGITCTTIDQVKSEIKKVRRKGKDTILCTFGTIQKIALHPQQGIPLLYHDQMNIIASHLAELKCEDDEKNTAHQKYVQAIQGHISALKSTKKKAKLTRKILKSQKDWLDWESAEHKQLRQYHEQGMFSEPQPIPPEANCLPFMWTYVVKDDGTKKARAPCNGSPRMQGTVTLGETYAASLDQTASKIFWATAAASTHIVIGADAANAFAEAPAPMAPLYMKLDTQFHSWWKSTGRPPIPPGYGVKVLKAIQGHPESPRLWATLINKIITDIGFIPCAHEPCLYHHPNYKGQKLYFLRQVDDFAISSPTQDIAHEIIDIIDSHMTIKVKPLGIIERFNGVDISQTKHYIKLSNETYINKILATKTFKDEYTSHLPIPMSEDTAYNRKIENATPLSKQDMATLEVKYGYSYRQAIGELIYAMVTCRPDISFALIKLSQYSASPAEEHFTAVHNIYKYLKKTPNNGIYYWRPKPRNDRDEKPNPTCSHANNYKAETREQTDPKEVRATVDSDFANDTTHRRSVTGICIKLAGGCIYYKTRFQPTVSLSSTEAEFIAACEAAKAILYVRSILNDIGISQDSATTLYEDNQGALLMANSGQPTKRTRHMDTKYFAIQHWVDIDLLTLKRVGTTDNESDAMTKNLGRTLFYRHLDYMMGKVIPEYAHLTVQHCALRSTDAQSTGG